MTTSTTVPTGSTGAGAMTTPAAGPKAPTRSGAVSLPIRWWRALGAEWTKLTSIRSTYISLALAVVIAAGIGALMALAVSVDPNSAQAPEQGALSAVALATVGISLGQFVLLAFAALTITGEYATGTMRPTLSGVPGRGVLIAAKSTLVAAVLYVAAFVMSATSALAAAPLLDDAGLKATELVEFSARNGLSITLLGLFVVGLGAVLRSTAGTITATLGLVFAPMIVGGIVNNSAVSTVIDYLPNSLMDAVSGAADGRHGAAVSGLLLGGWALLALIAGYVVLRRRDA